jgi:hypothetical protein
MLLVQAVLSRPAIQAMYVRNGWGVAPSVFANDAQFMTLGFAMNWELLVIRDKLKTQTSLAFSRSMFSLFTRAIGCLSGLIGGAASTIVDGVCSIAFYGKQLLKPNPAIQRDRARVDRRSPRADERWSSRQK